MRFGTVLQAVMRVTQMSMSLDDNGVSDVTAMLARIPVIYQQGKKDARIYLR